MRRQCRIHHSSEHACRSPDVRIVVRMACCRWRRGDEEYRRRHDSGSRWVLAHAVLDQGSYLSRLRGFALISELRCSRTDVAVPNVIVESTAVEHRTSKSLAGDDADAEQFMSMTCRRRRHAPRNNTAGARTATHPSPVEARRQPMTVDRHAGIARPDGGRRSRSTIFAWPVECSAYGSFATAADNKHRNSQ